jgi:4-alpha-glucanotransferase
VEHCLAYTGTHDNDTLSGWLSQASPAELDYVESYLGYAPPDPVWALLREAWRSVAAWAIAPMQDILGLGSEARMNTPSTVGGNWAWRLGKGEFDDAAVARLREITRLYGREAKGRPGATA